jgi:para-nitrobenzyl esterase
MVKHFMKTASIVSFALVTLACTTPFGTQTSANSAKIESGLLRGAASGDVISFKGIPYAAPPVGALRWQPPQPVMPWQGTRDAIAYGNDCVQLPVPGDAGASGSTRGEDCLVLNLWRPAAIDAGAKLPVLVWIHGGGFLNGSASAPYFDGSQFARQGVVLVSVNYRLGRMGFFAHPALSASGQQPLANYGLMDQLAALRWVQRNVAAFGGDPGQVTIAGESAGGLSVLHLLSLPDARGLFHRAAVLSGGGRSHLGAPRQLKEATGLLPSAEASGLAFAESVGIADVGEAGLRALRALPAEKVNGDMSMNALREKPTTYTGGPVIDGKIVTSTPAQNILRGNVARVPLIIGSTGADVGVDYPPDRTRPLDFFGADAERARRLYDPEGKLPPDVLATQIATDMTMHEPARFVARQMTTGGTLAWLYRFDYVADYLRPKVSGATHASELSYLFNQMDARHGKDVTARDRAMAKTFHDYFVNFAKHGDPNGPGLPPWPRFNPAKFELMMFLNDGSASVQPDPWRERLALVERRMDDQAAQIADSPLGGTSWQVVRFRDAEGNILVAKDPSQYTLEFIADGQLSARIACNRGRGTWKSPGISQLSFGPLALTRAMCPAEPMDRLTRDWAAVRSYVIRDGRLYLSLMADGGIYEFQPMPKLK